MGGGKGGREEEGREGTGRADPHPGLEKCKGGNPTCDTHSNQRSAWQGDDGSPTDFA